jgi:hypothetical protein
MNRQAQEKSLKLMLALDKKTSNGELKWTDAGAGNYEVEIGSYSVRISEEQQSRTGSLIVVHIFDKAGNIIDRFDDEDLIDMSVPTGFTSIYFFMSELYGAIGRLARGADLALDELLETISE